MPNRNSKKFKKMIEIYGIVKSAQILGLKAIKAGVDASLPYKKVLDYINNSKNGKYKGKFIHSLGHSIGIEVHDTGCENGIWQRHKPQG